MIVWTFVLLSAVNMILFVANLVLIKNYIDWAKDLSETSNLVKEYYSVCKRDHDVVVDMYEEIRELYQAFVIKESDNG